MKENGYVVFLRKDFVDITAWKDELGYAVECKGYDLSRKQQYLATKQIRRNVSSSREILEKYDLHIERMLEVLVAYSFSYNSRGVYQFTPNEFIRFI